MATDSINRKNDTVIKINDDSNSSSYRHRIDIPALTSEQFEALLNRIAGPSTPPPVPSALGNPGPLGLGAFALTTFMLSVFNAGSNLIDSELEGVVLPVALFYGGVAQFAAGMWEFRTENTFGATAFTSYGAFWMSFAGYVYFIVPTIANTGNTQKATGLFLLSWFIFTLYMNVAAYRTSKVLFLLFLTLNITLLLLIIGNLTNTSVVINIGGWIGIITAFIAWYGSAAVVINSTFRKSVLPIGLYHPPKEEQ
jgi:succinate-acetate transporter protein